VNNLVFPGRALLPINNDSVWRLLQQMAWTDDQGRMVALHGFRSTFSEWANTHANTTGNSSSWRCRIRSATRSEDPTYVVTWSKSGGG
jgi:hypothetical protein